MTALIVLENEPILGEEITEYLTEIGYQVTLATSLAQFNSQFRPEHRLAILDLGLPDGDGLSLIKELRAKGSRLGIVVFSARCSSRDKIDGLDLGADHYLGKGCELDELAATLSALARRLDPPSEHCWRLELGPRRLCMPDAGVVTLSQQDLIVLRCLMQSPNTNISRKQIIEALGFDYLTYDQRRLDTQMRRLRRKVDQSSNLKLPVNTLRNAGYCFYADAQIEG